jgi:hypothetical protein
MIAAMNTTEITADSKFNASITVTELLMKTLENAGKELARRCVQFCASKYQFDYEEAIRELGLENVTVNRKPMAKRTSKKTSTEAGDATEEKTSTEKKSKIPMPWSNENVDFNLCHGLAYSYGLFTQCPKAKMENGNYCSTCQKQSETNASGIPNCGTIEQRLATDLMEFQDPKKRKPTSYLKVLEKRGISIETAEEEARNQGKPIDERHLAPVEETSGKRGRPKKAPTTVEATEGQDLFQKQSDSEAEKAEDKPKAKRSKLTEEEKVKRAEEEAAKKIRQAMREANKGLLSRFGYEDLPAAKKDLKLKTGDEVYAELCRRAEQIGKESDEKHLPVAVAVPVQEENKTETPIAKQSEPEPQPAAEEEKPKKKKVSVTRFTHDGVEYLKKNEPDEDGDILVYNLKKECVGVYDQATGGINFYEEEEEEYEN